MIIKEVLMKQAIELKDLDINAVKDGKEVSHYEASFYGVKLIVRKKREFVFKNGHSNWEGKKMIAYWNAYYVNSDGKILIISEADNTRKEAFQNGVVNLIRRMRKKL